MASFSPLYTGRDSAAKFPELDALERSTQRASDLQIKGAEMKLDKALKDKEKFQKMLEIDPVVAVSSANAARQASRLQEYNTKWAKRYADAKGELSFADEVEMANDKKLLQAEQNKILADQEQFLNAQQTIARDTRGYYDRNAFDKAKQQYFETGELPPNMLDVAPQSMTAWLRTKSKELPTRTIPKVVNGVRVDTKEIDKADAQNLILEGMSEEARLKQIIIDFDNWTKTAPDKEVYDLLKDYDKDNNGVISPEESKYAHQGASIADNPIAKWAMNNPVYLENAMGTKEGASKNIPTGSKGKGGLSINFGGQQIEVSPAFKRTTPQTYGDKVYYNAYAFPGKISLANVPTQNGVAFIGKRSRNIPAGNVQGYLKDYIADEDILIVEPTKGYENFGIDPGGLIGIPASNIEGIDNLPIKGENGQVINIGELRKGKGNTAPKKKAY